MPRIVHASLTLVVLTACAGGDSSCTDTDDTDSQVAGQELVLQDSKAAKCTPTLYWPAAMTHFPVAAFAVEAPSPPYEIIGFSAKLFTGVSAFNTDRDCTLDAGLRVFAFILDGDPSTLTVSASGALDVEVVAEATLTRASTSTDPFTAVEVTLPTPVRVEKTGTLWLGYDATLDAGSGAGACLAGCDSTRDGFWGWMAEGNNFSMPTGWAARTDGNVLLSAMVKTD